MLSLLKAELAGADDLRNDRGNRPGDLKTSDHDIQYKISSIQRRDGVMEATRRAHREGAAADFGKAAPTHYESLVAAEICKGCMPNVAAQRVVNSYGSLAKRTTLTKAEDAEDRLLEKAADIYHNTVCSRTEALRVARLRSPSLYKRLVR